MLFDIFENESVIAITKSLRSLDTLAGEVALSSLISASPLKKGQFLKESICFYMRFCLILDSSFEGFHRLGGKPEVIIVSCILSVF